MDEAQRMAQQGEYLNALLVALFAAVAALSGALYRAKSAKAKESHEEEQSAPLSSPAEIGQEKADSARMRAVIEAETEKRVEARIAVLSDEIRNPVRALEALRGQLKRQEEQIAELVSAFEEAKSKRGVRRGKS